MLNGVDVLACGNDWIQSVRLTVPFSLFAEVLQVSTCLYGRQLHNRFVIRLSSCTEMLSGWQSSSLNFYLLDDCVYVLCFLSGFICCGGVWSHWPTYFESGWVGEMLFVDKPVAVMKRHVTLWRHDCVWENRLGGGMTSMIDVRWVRVEFIGVWCSAC